MLKQMYQVVPSSGTKRFFDVNIEKKLSLFFTCASSLPNSSHRKIVADAPFLDECTLSIEKNHVHVGCKSSCHHIGN
jgi:hypothetical protein